MSDTSQQPQLSKEELEAYIKFIQKRQEEDSIQVTPTPCFVIKTHLVALEGGSNATATPKPSPLPPSVSSGMKVFINITHHATLPPIATRPGEGGGEASRALSVPLAMGEPRIEKDKAGEDSLALDVIVHPGVTQDCEKDRSGGFRHWLVDFCLQYFTRKHGGVLSPQYRIPQLKYKGRDGVVHSQRLRKQKAVVVEGEGQGQASPSGTGGGGPPPASNPLSILKHAGALPPDETAMVPVAKVSKAAAVAAANYYAAETAKAPLPRGPPRDALQGGGSTTLDMRLVEEERKAEEKTFADRVAEEVGKKGEDGTPFGAPLPSLLQSTLGETGGGGSSSSSSGGGGDGGIGLVASSTKRVLRSQAMEVRVEVEGEGAGKGGEGGAGLLCPLLDSSGGGGGGEGGMEYTSTLPPTSPPTVKRVRVEIHFPPPNPPPPFSQISIVGGAVGTWVKVGVKGLAGGSGWKSARLTLPLPCNFIQKSDGLGGGAETVKAQYFSQEGVLLLTLTPLEVKAPLPPLPSPPLRQLLPATLPVDGEGGGESCTEGGGMDAAALRQTLGAYVEAGGVEDYTPDVGSRLWLLAQALSSDDGRSDRGGGGEGAGSPARAHPGGGGGSAGREGAVEEEVLPEDRFIAGDALSLHYMRMKEEERAKARQKDAEREKEREREKEEGGGEGEKGKKGAAIDTNLFTDLL